MTPRRFVLTWLLAACQPVHPVDDQASATPAGEAQMSDSDTEEVVAAFLEAWVAKDIDGVSATLADDVIYIDTHPGPGMPSQSTGKEDVKA